MFPSGPTFYLGIRETVSEKCLKLLVFVYSRSCCIWVHRWWLEDTHTHSKRCRNHCPLTTCSFQKNYLNLTFWKVSRPLVWMDSIWRIGRVHWANSWELNVLRLWNKGGLCLLVGNCWFSHLFDPGNHWQTGHCHGRAIQNLGARLPLLPRPLPSEWPGTGHSLRPASWPP